MAIPYSRGKESFRVFKRHLKDFISDTVKAIKEGEEYTSDDIYRFMNTLNREYIQTLSANGLDVELWGDRAIDLTYKSGENIITRFQLTASQNLREDVNEEIETEEPEPSPIEADGKLLGYDIITKENKALARKLGKPRKRFFTNIEELARYVQDVPYVLYIQIIRDSNGKAKEYRVWVEKIKDQKKPKKSVS